MKFRWTGSEFIPHNPNFADKHFVVDQDYVLSETRDRSDESHGHYFACISHAWQSLPEEESMVLPTAEHLRAKALIACGYSTPRQIVLDSPRDAIRMAGFAEETGPYDIVTVTDRVVTIMKPESQAYRAMGRDRFEKSKNDVIEYCAALIGVSAEELKLVGSSSSKKVKK